MSIEENKAVIRRMFDDVINQGDLDAVDAFFAPDHFHYLGNQQFAGPEGVRELFASMRAALPDLRITIDEMVAEGDRVALLFTITGTHRATLAGIPATGKRVAYTGADFFRLVDGKIVERHGEVDFAGLLRQLSS